MSVRAYRIEKIDYTKEPSFNLWHDGGLIKWLELNTDVDLSQEIIRISVDDAKQALKEAKLEKEVALALKNDIAAEVKRGNDWLEYFCF